MKKVLLSFIVLLMSASLAFSQTYNATLAIDNVDVSTLSAGDDVVIPVRLEYMDPGGLDIGFQFFIQFDHAILTWKGSNPNPTPGVTNFNPVMPYNSADWAFNDNGTALVVLWNDPTFNGVYMADGEQFFDLIFTYNGGLNQGDSSPLVFQTAKSVSNGGKLVKGPTEMYSQLFDYFVLTLNQGSVYVGGTTATNWTGGATSGDWFLSGNWDNGVPTSADDAVIPAGTPHDPVIDNFIAECNNLDIASGVTFTIMDAGALTVAGTLTNDGAMMMEGNNIGASLIAGSMAGAGTFEYDRYLESGPTGTHAGWHFISSPLDNTVTGDFVSYWVKEFNPATGMFVDIDPWGDFNGVLCDDEDYSQGNVGLNVMQGYSVKRDLDYLGGAPCPQGIVPANDDIIEFGGDVLAGLGPWGEFVANATNPGTMADINDGGYSMTYSAQWNLFGNPYPSGLDWDAVTIPAGLNNGIYFWDNTNDQYASYVGGVGNNGGTNEIPPTQGFFVEATGNGTLSFDNGMRIHSTQQFYKEQVDDVVKLMVSSGDMKDETTIRFLEGTNQTWDKAFDAKKMFNYENVSLYTTENDLQLSINTQPAVKLVHMAFVAPASGYYTIEAVETSDFSNVVLEDVLTGIETDLLTDSYTFEYTEGENANRFIVHFTPLGTPELEANSIRIWSSERNIYVSVPQTVTGDVAVYNMMGQEVVSNKVIPGMNVIPVNDANTYYVVKVMSGNNVKTEKVFIR